MAAKKIARYLKFPPLAKDTDEFDYGEVLFTKYKKSIQLKHLKTCFQDLRSVLWVLAAQRGIRLLSSGEETTTYSDTYVCHGAQLNGIFSKNSIKEQAKKEARPLYPKAPTSSHIYTHIIFSENIQRHSYQKTVVVLKLMGHWY